MAVTSDGTGWAQTERGEALGGPAGLVVLLRRLTDQQKARVAKIQDKRRQRADSRAKDSLAAADNTKQQTGRVVVRHGRSLLLRCADGSSVHAMFRANLGEVV